MRIVRIEWIIRIINTDFIYKEINKRLNIFENYSEKLELKQG